LLYLAALFHWASYRVLSWRRPIMIRAAFCVEDARELSLLRVIDKFGLLRPLNRQRERYGRDGTGMARRRVRPHRRHPVQRLDQLLPWNWRTAFGATRTHLFLDYIAPSSL
jgi:hypothetical protein